jgi:glycosyltransferase involved in cell wall biosynthesis
VKVCLLTYRAEEGAGLGIERYCYELYRGLQGKGIDVKLIGKYNSLPPYLNDLTVIPLKAVKNKNNILHAVTPRQSLILPFLKKTVVTYSDLIPLILYPKRASKFGTLAYGFYRIFWETGKFAQRVIVISTLIKNQLVNLLNVNEDKIVVIPLGVSEKFRPLPHKIRGRIGFFGSTVKRKRIDLVIKTFKIFLEKYDYNAQLYLYTGVRPKKLYGFDPEQIVNELKIPKEKVKIFSFVPEEKIVEAYNSFDILVYPSEYEGFGLPILEAQRCGIPTITLKSSMIPEEVKKATIQCKDIFEIAEKCYELLTNKNYYRKVSRKSVEYSKKFTWKKCVEKTIDVYESF